ncbi:MAG TPA: hypothetical protein VFJ82_13290, partial [Longimicrobium sp.]|nr:hypothetical protein [Longimicrobium sp.]
GRPDRIFGGQRVNVTLTSSNVVYDSVAQVLTFDVTVQNLLAQRMGSDGATVSGVKVFFASGPTTTEGSGVVEAAETDGSGVFTASGQPYYAYPAALGPDSVSAARQWRFNVARSARKFVFSVYVAAPLVPAIVFEMAAGGNRDIYRMGIDGNDLTRLTTNPGTDLTPTVAQGRVVFTSYRDGNAELYSVPLKGGAETRLTTTATNENNPALSPDGTRLAFVRPSGAGARVYFATANADSVQAANASATGDVIESTPSWASSTQLAFGSTAASSSDIYGVTPGGTPTLLAGGSNAEVEPAWSPDGTQLAFASNRTRDTELYLLTVSTGAVTRLTTRTGSDNAPNWLLDGRIVYTCTQGGTLRLCIVDPANPAGASLISTPNAADHAAAVRF